jgi:hypothetical protein
MPDSTQPASAEPSAEYPAGPFFPTVFADGAQSAAWGRGVVKCYLFRSDPNFRATGPAKDQAVAQLVVPYEGFAAMVIFFQQTLDRLVAEGGITAARVEELRGIVRGDASGG